MRLPSPPAALVVVQAPGHSIDGQRLELGPGDLLGRAAAARLLLPATPGTSEAHALVSLRGPGLVLLPLRGAVLARTPVEDPHAEAIAVADEGVELLPGLELRLGPSVTLVVEDLRLPSEVLAIDGLPQGRPQPLPGSAAAVVAGPPERLVPDHPTSALLWLWLTDTGVMAQRPHDPVAEPVPMGAALPSPCGHLRLLRLGLPSVSTPLTHTERPPISIELRAASALIRQAGPSGPELELSGKAFELIQALADVAAEPHDSPLRHHKALADAIWGSAYSKHAWKTLASRVRAALTVAGLPPGLIDSDQRGRWSLDLGPEDTLVDLAAKRPGRPLALGRP